MKPITNQPITFLTHQSIMKMKHFFIAIACLCSVLSMSTRAYAQAAGSLDSTFGSNGKITFPFTPLDLNYDNDFNHMIIQSDGKIVAVGKTSFGQTGNTYFAHAILVRTMPDGSVDNTFGQAGRVVDSSNIQLSYLYKVRQQTDGKLLVFGRIRDTLYVARYNTNGSLDNSFGVNGKMQPTVRNTLTVGIDLQLLPTGKILLLYSTALNDHTSSNIYLRRLNANGTIDNSFNVDILNINSGGNSPWEAVSEIAFQSTGKIVIAAYGIRGNLTQDTKTYIFRYNTNGTLDNTFAVGGVDSTNIYYNNYFFGNVRMKIEPGTDKILFGVSGSLPTTALVIYKYLSNGGLDTSFGTNGLLFLSQNRRLLFSNMIYQNDGKILFIYSQNLLQRDMLTRIENNGTIDTNFGQNGAAPLPFMYGGSTAPPTVCIQPNTGKLVIAYPSTAIGASTRIGTISRYLLNTAVGTTNTTAADMDVRVSPNPILESFNITYNLDSPQAVSISVQDVLGRTVVNLLNNVSRAAGEQTDVFSISKELPNGVYFITIQTLNGSKSIKIVKN